MLLPAHTLLPTNAASLTEGAGSCTAKQNTGDVETTAINLELLNEELTSGCLAYLDIDELFRSRKVSRALRAAGDIVLFMTEHLDITKFMGEQLPLLGVENLANILAHCPKISHFTAPNFYSEYWIPSLSVSHIAVVVGNTKGNLKHLNLDRCNIGDKGLDLISAHAGESLEHLCISTYTSRRSSLTN
jgi:hypothetical protein